MPTPRRGAGSLPVGGGRPRPRPPPLLPLPAPVTRLDAAPGGGATVAQLVETGVPSYLSIEALVEMACRSQCGADWRTVYALVRRQLVSMRLLPAQSPQLEPLRHMYQKMFADLLLRAHRTSFPSPLTDQPVLAPPAGAALHRSRYRSEFDELAVLGRGGFAVVCRCRSRVDQQEYAVKRIPFRCRSAAAAERTVREVAVFASLSHPNIVKYNTAWLEVETAPEQVIGESGSVVTSQSVTNESSSSRAEMEDSCVRFERDGSSIGALAASLTTVTIAPSSGGVGGTKGVVQRSHRPGGVQSVTHGETGSAADPLLNGLSSRRECANGAVDALSGGCRERDAPHGATGGAAGGSGDGALVRSKRDVRATGAGPGAPALLSSDGAVVPLSGAFGAVRPAVSGRRLLTTVTPSSSGSSAVSVSRSDWTPSAAVGWLTLHIQMQLCERTLKEWLLERNHSRAAGSDQLAGVDSAQCKHILRDVLLGVNFIHQRGIIHRDLKPANIFLAFSGRALIGDFGLARPCAVGSARQPLTPLSDQTEGVGTATYASPEQAAGGDYDQATDLYSVGMVTYELFVPFGTAMERCRHLERLRHQRVCCPELEARWPEIARAVLSLTEPSPMLRPCSAHLLASPLFTSAADRILQLETAAAHQNRLLEARAARSRQLAEQLDSCRRETAVTERLLRSSCRRLRQQLVEKNRTVGRLRQQLANKDLEVERLRMMLQQAGLTP